MLRYQNYRASLVTQSSSSEQGNLDYQVGLALGTQFVTQPCFDKQENLRDNGDNNTACKLLT